MTTVHGSFTLDRHYPAPPSRVFHAFADPSLKRRGYVEGEGRSVEHHALDFRPGGHETSRFRLHGGPRSRTTPSSRTSSGTNGSSSPT